MNNGTGSKEDLVVARVKKSATEEVRFALSEYRGQTYIQIRVWYLDKDGEMKPSYKGIAFRLEEFHALKDGIAALEEPVVARLLDSCQQAAV